MKAKRITITVDTNIFEGCVEDNVLQVLMSSGEDFGIACEVTDVDVNGQSVVEASDIGYEAEEE
jgi:hypothetical protein